MRLGLSRGRVTAALKGAEISRRKPGAVIGPIAHQTVAAACLYIGGRLTISSVVVVTTAMAVRMSGQESRGCGVPAGPVRRVVR